MKVLLINTLYEPEIEGGAEISTQKIAEIFAAHGHQVTVLATSDNTHVTEINGVVVQKVHIPNIYWRWNVSNKSTIKRIIWRCIDTYNIFTFLKLHRMISNLNPDLIHTNNIAGFSVAVWTIARLLKIPVIHTIRDYYLLCGKSSCFRGGKSCEGQCSDCRLFTLNKRAGSQSVDAVVGVSNNILSRHLEHGYFKNATFRGAIYNAAPKVINPPPKSIERDIKILGYIGAIAPVKGIDLIISFLNECPNYRCILAGRISDTKYYNELCSKLIRSKQLEYIGYVSPAIFFEKIDILVHPAIWPEPFPRTLIEATTYEKPIVISDAGGAKEFVLNAKFGELFQAGDIRSLKKKIHKVANSYQAYSISQNFQDHKILFSEETVYKEYLDIYKRISGN